MKKGKEGNGEENSNLSKEEPEGLIDGMVVGDDPIATGSDEHYQHSGRGYAVLGNGE